MKSKVLECIEKHNKKYNCAQSIACVYAPLLNISEEEAFRSVEGLGFGMGVNLTCGVLSSLAYLVSLKYSDRNLENPQSKHICYDKMKEIYEDFNNYIKDTNCYTLKGLDKGKFNDCSYIIAYGAYLAEKYIFEGLFTDTLDYLKYTKSND